MWTTRTLGDICDHVDGVIQTGPFGSQLHESDYVPDGVPVVMPKNILDGKIDTSDIAFISEENANRLGRHKMAMGDIVYGRRGDIGRRGLISERENGWFCGTGCLRVSLGDRVLDPRYLYYYLGQPSVVGWIANQAVGATMPNLNTGILRSVVIKYPRLLVQQRIASILSAYDDLIENNTRRITILEEMAQMIYREWFVSFRFPGHENVRMVESEFGPIPEGWTATTLGNVLTLEYGKALKAEDRKSGPIPVYGSSGVVGQHSEALANGPGVIVGRKGNVGSVFLCHSDFWVIDTAYYVRSDLSLYFLYFNLRTQNFLNNDAAVPGLNRNQAHSLPLIVPHIEQLCSFDRNAGPLLALKRCLELRNLKLRSTRDFLLPKLISGEVPVEAADEAAAELMEQIA